MLLGFAVGAACSLRAPRFSELGFARFRVRAGAAARRLQFGGAGLAGDRRRPGSPPRCRCRRAPRRSSAAARCARPRRSIAARRGARRAAARTSARGRRPPSAIVAATIAICSGARQHLALADRRRADVQFALDLRRPPAACSRRRPATPGVVVEAEAFGRRHQARRAELDAERREHRVARHGEGELERAAAFLAVGVVQLDAVERRVGRVGEDVCGRGDVRPAARRVSVTILNVEPGRLQAVEADARRPPGSAPVAGCIATTPPSWPPSAVDGGALHGGRDRRAHRARPRCGAATREHARCPASSSPPGVPRRRRRARAPGRSCRRSRRAARLRLPAPCAARAGIGPTSPTTALGRFAERRAARPGRRRRALGEHRAVAREQRRARAAASCARLSVSPARRPGKASERDQAIASAPSPSLTILSVEAAARACRTAACARAPAPSTQPPPARARLAGDAQRSSRSRCAAPRGRRRRTRSAEIARCEAASMSRVHRRVVAARPRARRSCSASASRRRGAAVRRRRSRRSRRPRPPARSPGARGAARCVCGYQSRSW